MNIAVFNSKGERFEYTRGDKNPLDKRSIVAQMSDIPKVASTLNGTLFNPNNIGHSMFKKDKIGTGYVFNLKKCSKNCFDIYIKFLRTKNSTDLRVAERRFKDEK